MLRVRELPSTYVIEIECDKYLRNFDGNVLMFSTRGEAQEFIDDRVKTRTAGPLTSVWVEHHHNTP